MIDNEIIKNTDYYIRENFYLNYKNNWISYADAVNNISTMEDFIVSDKIKETLKNYNKNFIFDNKKDAINNIEKAVGIDNSRKLAREIKAKLADTIKKDDIALNYKDFVTVLLKKIENI